MNKDLNNRHDKKQLLVENKLSFAGPDSELSIYDTYQNASRVGLNAPQLLYCGMVKGKKIMHENVQVDNDEQGKIFLPHESFVMPPGGYVEIDFPEANVLHPTTCLTIEIAKERIEKIAERMRDLTTLEAVQHDWQYQPKVLHAHHTTDTQQLLEKLVALFTNDHPDKEIMMDLGVSELIIKLLRQQGRDVLLSYCQSSPDATGITAVIYFLEQNFQQALDIEHLCRLACMSRSRLYTEFKKQLDCSPGEFQQQLRLHSASESLQLGTTVTVACFDAGFSDLSHFSRRFTAFFGCSPSQYRQQHSAETIK